MLGESADSAARARCYARTDPHRQPWRAHAPAIPTALTVVAGGGHAPHTPTADTRRIVVLAMLNGLSLDRIAAILGITRAELERHYRPRSTTEPTAP